MVGWKKCKEVIQSSYTTKELDCVSRAVVIRKRVRRSGLFNCMEEVIVSTDDRQNRLNRQRIRLLNWVAQIKKKKIEKLGEVSYFSA